jgi:nicotinamidase-related amidase
MSTGDSAGKSARPLVLDPRTSAVVCIELQNGVLGAETPLPALAEEARGMVKSAARLLAGARAAGVPVVHSTFGGWLGSTNFGTAPLWRATAPGTADWGPGHPGVEVLPELLEPSDIVLPRHHGLSATSGTELVALLRGRGVTDVIVAGVSLNVAIPLTVGDLSHEHLRAYVPRDAAVGTPAEYSEQVLRHTIGMLARVTTVDAIVGAWEAHAATAPR